jgi:hypothetical protein
MEAYSVSAEFEATFDEVVDVHVRQSRRQLAARRQTARALTIFNSAIGAMGLTTGVALLLGIPMTRGETLSLLAIGGAAGALFTSGFDQRITRAAREIITAQYGPRFSTRCEIELRPSSLWVRQAGIEISLDWRLAQGVEDTPEGIELWFPWGLVVARNRGFSTPADRERFLAEARAKVPST